MIKFIHMQLLLSLIGFLLIAVAADKISHLFPRLRLPIITGLLFIGIISGPSLLGFIDEKSVSNLYFLKELSLAFIAFCAGAELHFEDLKSQMKSIKWMTFGQFVVTFCLSAILIYYMSAYIPFMENMSHPIRLALSLLVSTIFVARSPASAIAVINEMRAKGPFTKTAIGVTVLKDVLVIILFTICFAVADALVQGVSFDFKQVLFLCVELILSFSIGIALGKLIDLIVLSGIPFRVKSLILVIIGYGVYFFSHLLYDYSDLHLGFSIYIEPLLICIVASLYVVNFSKNRREFTTILEKTVPYIYVLFFTITGASISLVVLAKMWIVSLLFFSVRLIGIILGSFVGLGLAGDSLSKNKMSWMAYVTQAGVALGLVAVVSEKYPQFGSEFSTLMISVIILNEIIGPPLFKWAIIKMGESHTKNKKSKDNKTNTVALIGLEGQSLTLFRELVKHHYSVKLFTKSKSKSIRSYQGVEVDYISSFDEEEMTKAGLNNHDTIVLLKTDADNLEACEVLYESFGTKNIIVRINDRSYIDKFKSLGALVVDPSTLMINLLEHMVRSPLTTSILLGDDEVQDTEDVVMSNCDLDGVALRDLHLPSDIVILATKRNEQVIVSTGYTRIRLGDVLTLFGSVESIDRLRLLMAEDGGVDF